MRRLRTPGFALACVLSFATAACGSRNPSRCERACTKESECAREATTETDRDWGECVEECARLERDPQLVSFVDQHVSCVDDALGCRQILECP